MAVYLEDKRLVKQLLGGDYWMPLLPATGILWEF